MKKQAIGRLLEIAGEKKGLLVLSGGLAALSAACALAPYLSVYHILAELLAKVEDPSRIDGPLMTHWALSPSSVSSPLSSSSTSAPWPPTSPPSASSTGLG